MTNGSNPLSDLFAACAQDAELKARFMQDPQAVLAERGINVPAGMDVAVLEDSDACMNITIPAAPQAPKALSDEELSLAAGGFPSAVYEDCFHISYIECVRSEPQQPLRGGRRF